MQRNYSLKIFHPLYVAGLRRLGNDYDGGYIVHDASLKDVSYLINYGIGYNTNFEKDFFKATGMPTFAFDPTLRDIKPIVNKLKKGQLVPFLRHLKNFVVWTRAHRKLKNYQIKYIEEGIASQDSADYKTFKYHFDKYQLTDKKFIFKLDVEGAEFEVFEDNSIFPYLKKAVQILIEFHYAREKIELIKDILTKLSETHSVIHIHANNHAGVFDYHGKAVPEAFEVTLLSNDYLPEKKYNTVKYPIEGLDQPCDRLQKDIILDFFY